MTITLCVNGTTLSSEAGVTVAAALLDHGITTFRQSPSGEPRSPLCGMGVCHECRVSVDGHPHQRACMTQVRDGMEIVTGGGGGTL